MKLKAFLGSLAALSASGALRSNPTATPGSGGAAFRLPIILPYLSPGDLIAITCPACCVTLQEIQPAKTQIESWGIQVRIGDTVVKKGFTFGGGDSERTADFQRMIDDPKVNAILCARGGYGSVRIVDQLNFTRFNKEPKWIIGFGDIMELHGYLIGHANAASLHSKMCNSFPDD